MDTTAKEFLTTLLATPGVSGYEQAVQDVVRSYVGAFADDDGRRVVGWTTDGARRVELPAEPRAAWSRDGEPSTTAGAEVELDGSPRYFQLA